MTELTWDAFEIGASHYDSPDPLDESIVLIGVALYWKGTLGAHQYGDWLLLDYPLVWDSIWNALPILLEQAKKWR